MQVKLFFSGSLRFTSVFGPSYHGRPLRSKKVLKSEVHTKLHLGMEAATKRLHEDAQWENLPKNVSILNFVKLFIMIFFLKFFFQVFRRQTSVFNLWHRSSEAIEHAKSIPLLLAWAFLCTEIHSGWKNVEFHHKDLALSVHFLVELELMMIKVQISQKVASFWWFQFHLRWFLHIL